MDVRDTTQPGAVKHQGASHEQQKQMPQANDIAACVACIASKYSASKALGGQLPTSAM